MPELVQTSIVFLGVLSVLVLVHELGHFVAARLMGIRVEEFAFGLPFTKPIFKFKRKETQYAIYPLFFGGFVRLYGEDSEVKGEKGRDYWSRGKKQRMVVVGAGVVMNVVLALVGFSVLYSMVGIPVKKTEKVTIVKVDAGSPAEVAGLKVEDRVVAVEGKKISETEEFSRLMKSWAGIGVNLTVERGGGVMLFEGIAEKEVEVANIYLIPRANPPEGQGPVGVGIAKYPFMETRLCNLKNLGCYVDAAKQGMESTGVWMGRVLDGLRQIGKSLAAGKAPEGVSGPVGIFQLTGLVAQSGLLPLLELTSVLSVNLAVFNVLPIPALDGGRMLFIWLEWVRRKRLPADFEAKVNSWGMAALLALMGLITLQDVWRGFVK
jgi:regulator of sigma E protease